MDEVLEVVKHFERDHIVTITLEEDGSQFTVQSALLCHASAYFMKALQGPFKEADERTLHLPGCDSTVFKVFIYWLCERRLPSSFMWDEDETAANDGYRWQKLLIRLWVFADAHLVPKLERDIISSVLMIFDSADSTTLDIVQLAYELTPEGSKIREVFLAEGLHLFMDSLADKGRIDTETLEPFARNPGLVMDFMNALVCGIGENADQAHQVRTSFQRASVKYPHLSRDFDTD